MNGIILDKQTRELFEKINQRKICDECRQVRVEFREEDYNGQQRYSEMSVGFSSNEIRIPLDVLIVLDSHGGGSIFRDQKSVVEEVEEMKRYYVDDGLLRLNQYLIRQVIAVLDHKKITWVFSDLIKCFVWNGKSKNTNTAVSFCKKYLHDQIAILQPKVIISLGNRVSHNFGIPNGKANHGAKLTKEINGHQCVLVHCLFPSGRNGDDWGAGNGWVPILNVLYNELNINEKIESSVIFL